MASFVTFLTYLLYFNDLFYRTKVIFCCARIITKVSGTLRFNYKLTGAIFRRRRMQYTSSSSEGDIWARYTIHRTRQFGFSVNPGINCRLDSVFDLRFIYGLPVKHKDKSKEVALRNPNFPPPPPPHKKAMLNLKAVVVGLIQIKSFCKSFLLTKTPVH